MGTGDGTFVVRTAAGDAGALVIGVDTSLDGLAAGFSAARRKRLDNAVFVVAAAESLPAELRGIAGEVRVQFPWAGLLRAVLDADPVVACGLAGLLVPGGALEVVLSVVPRDGIRGVGALDAAGTERVARRLTAVTGGRLEVLAVDRLEPAAVAALHSSWAKRLGAGRTRPAWRIRLRRGPGSGLWPPDRGTA